MSAQKITFLKISMSMALVASIAAGCGQKYDIQTVTLRPGSEAAGDPLTPQSDPTGDISGDTDVNNGVPTKNPDGTTDVHYPYRGNLATVTFEDLYPQPGDADYNDFVMNFKITESFSADNQLTKIVVDFTPKHLGASYDHSLLMVLDGTKDSPSNITFKSTPLFAGDATVTVDDFDASGAKVGTRSFTSASDVTLIESTHKSYASSRMTINIKSPNANAVKDVGPIDISKYRMVLHVKNTNQDIDLVTVNSSVVDSNGFPFGLIVPTDWKYPTERTNIDGPYPNFKPYRQWLAGGSKGDIAQDNLKWFEHLAPGQESKVEGN